jgi:hypothetical protein
MNRREGSLFLEKLSGAGQNRFLFTDREAGQDLIAAHAEPGRSVMRSLTLVLDMDDSV